MNLTEKLCPPCKCRLPKEEKKTLIGKAYYFSELSGNKITSPLAGIVKRVFSNYSVQIIGLGGVQILLAIELTEKKTQTLDEIFRCQVRSEQRVVLHTTLFTIYQPTKIKWVVIHLPWQPTLLRKIKVNLHANSRPFLKLYYRNPFAKLVWKQPGEY